MGWSAFWQTRESTTTSLGRSTGSAGASARVYLAEPRGGEGCCRGEGLLLFRVFRGTLSVSAFLYKGALFGAEPVLLLCTEPGTAGYRGYREALRALLDAMFPGDMLTLPNETVML